MTGFEFPCVPCEQRRAVDIVDVQLGASHIPTAAAVCPECLTPHTYRITAGQYWIYLTAKADALEDWHDAAAQLTLADFGGAA